MKNKGVSEFTAYTVIGILCAVISFVTMIVLTRISSEAFFGKINKFITASTLVMSLAYLGLDSAYIRFYFEPPKNTSGKQLAWKCISPAFIVLVLISFIIMLLKDAQPLPLLIGGGGTFFAAAFVITIFSQFFNRFMTIYFRMNGDVLRFSIISIAVVVFTKTIFIPIYSITPKFEHNIEIASLLLAMFIFVLFVFNARRMIEISHNSNKMYKQVYRFAFLSSPVFIITYMNNYIPQIIISKYLGDGVLGIYSAALLFCSAILVLSTGFTTFWSPYMYKNYSTENETIRNIHDVVLLGCVLVLSLVLCFNDFIYLFIGDAFRKNQNIIGMLLIYPLVLIIVETTYYGISIKKKNEISLLIYLIYAFYLYQSLV